MNFKKLIYLSILTLGLFSCYDEGDLEADRFEPMYSITDNPDDAVQHYKYEFYNKYKSVIINDVKISDYKYNFNETNAFRMVAFEQNEELILKGFKLLENQFLNNYSEEFLKKNLPLNIILADSIFHNGYGNYDYTLSSCSKNYLAIGGIRNKEYTQEELNQLQGEINSLFWLNYLMKVKKLFTIPKEFYEVSSDYGLMAFMPAEMINFNNLGFITYGSLFEAPWGTFPFYPTKEQDIQQWFKWIFTNTKEKINEVCEGNPKMKQKFEIIENVMVKSFGKSIFEILKQ